MLSLVGAMKILDGAMKDRTGALETVGGVHPLAAAAARVGPAAQ